MNNYEAVLIFNPDLTDEIRNQQLDTFKEIIAQAGEVTSVDDWGKKKLAYEINDYKDGYYYIVDFKAEANHIKEFERRMRISDSIMRYMVIRKED
ncbi:MAG: 30S ribosomal protein S6 [Peptoniphilaceae bacterium]|nr:30S ribosomal protein S6 [Peptoniphilaceae bacterium]MDY6018428.1 30S ribosomal protein S6 [Anaerococcus sp.]